MHKVRAWCECSYNQYLFYYLYFQSIFFMGFHVDLLTTKQFVAACWDWHHICLASGSLGCKEPEWMAVLKQQTKIWQRVEIFYLIAQLMDKEGAHKGTPKVQRVIYTKFGRWSAQLLTVLNHSYRFSCLVTLVLLQIRKSSHGVIFYHTHNKSHFSLFHCSFISLE